MNETGGAKDPFEAFLFGPKSEEVSASMDVIGDMSYAQILHHVEELLDCLDKLEPLLSQFSPIIIKYFNEK